jgi:hypothetical protein
VNDVKRRTRGTLPERICPTCADPLRAVRSYQRAVASGTPPRQVNMYACDNCRTGRVAAHPYGALGLAQFYPVGEVPPDALV